MLGEPRQNDASIDQQTVSPALLHLSAPTASWELAICPSQPRLVARTRAGTSTVEVTNISKHGFWLLLDGRELFLSFDHFPWFRQATLDAILNLERPALQHLRWPDLDVDLPVDSIEHPECYPLKSKL